ncbi:NUDIX domain-containing protein [Streptomyces sp. A0958]|uniref:NUDIX domain-containing protein n=1 Tax=Streptomyces sp. A0958 TaxID=2563101 RepID=UPI00109ECA35|nr:NUDIX domain-containing protein [Streptomyces sp. A0958]THA63812.1 NUDIX domain-containing protein [Streptomyces sp. A0958]
MPQPPPSRSHIHAVVTAYLARHPAERHALAPLLAALDAPDDPTARTTLPGHITCSAAVVDRDGRVLHVRHNATGGLLLAPGGHVEPGDVTLLGAALREVEEETGIPAAQLCHTAAFLTEPADIDVHDIDANPAKGEPAHRHYDFRYVFHLVPEAVGTTLRADEVSAATWLPLTEATCPSLRAKLLAARLDTGPEPLNASVLIRNDRGEYLLHLRDHYPGRIWEPGAWSVLGGGRERQDTSPEATARRELHEETGLTLPHLQPFAVEEAIGLDGTTVLIQIFTGRWNGDAAALPLTEGVMLAWFDPQMMPRLRMAPSTLALVQRHARQAGPPKPASGTGAVPRVVGVHLYLEREGKVLLGLRHPDSAYAGNVHHVLAGHCERESAADCLAREAWEEAGLVVDPAAAELVHVVHLVDATGGPPRMQLFLRAEARGEPAVYEPDRCVSWGWWPVDALPDPIVPYTRAAIEGIRAGRLFTELGWGSA